MWFSTIRIARQRTGGIVRAYSERSIWIHIAILGYNIGFREAAHLEHATGAARTSLQCRGRIRSSMARGNCHWYTTLLFYLTN